MIRKRVVSGAVLAFGLAFASQAAAQVPQTVGVRGGVSVAKADVDLSDPFETFGEENRTGFAGSVFYNRDFGIFAFQPEASYLQKGVKEEDGRELKLQYVELAALLKAGIPLGIVKPSAFGGIGVNFETSCKLDDVKCTDEIPVIDTKSTEWVAVFGADVGIFLGSISLWADGRYSLGLSNISNTAIISDLKNKAWIFSAGIGFGI